MQVDAIIISTATKPFIDQTFYYITGYTEGIFESSSCILFPDYTCEIVIPWLEEESARKGSLPVHVFKTNDERKDAIKTLLLKKRRIGVNAEELTYKNLLELKEWLKDAELIDVSEAVRKARLVKDKKEIELLRKACKIASETADEIPNYIHEGIKEYEVAAELSYIMQKKGAVGPSFTIVSSFGARTAEPHYIGGEQRLKKGDFILLDFGALYKRYRSDITRTYILGKATEKHLDMYEKVLEAQRIGMQEIRAGIKGGDAHNTVERFINSTDYKGCFTHSLGHSIGLSVHDGGVLHPRMDLILEDNMVFTVEPGIYVSGFGGVRIEDNIVVKRDGAEVLTDAKKDELIEI